VFNTPPSVIVLALVFFAPVIIAFAIVENWQSNFYAVITFWYLLIADFLFVTGWFPFARDYWNLGKNDTQQAGNAPKEERPTHGDLKLIPRVMAGGMVVNNQVVAGVKFNKVRRFAQTLLNMRSVSESSVDLREDTWRVHFGGRDGYIKTRVRFEQVGAFVRKDARPNSPYVVSSSGWNVVQEVAHGNERVLQ